MLRCDYKFIIITKNGHNDNDVISEQAHVRLFFRKLLEGMMRVT
jgi:hypothetical protein